MHQQPYLSVVATSRNDNHGGNLIRRMELFIEGLISQCNRYDISMELVIVEWNPPQDTPRLAEILRWPPMGNCSVRIVEVPEALHQQFQHNDRTPIFQMIAKNVGIQRARGDFVLATNIDILFSDELMRYIAARKLRPGRMYRVDRYDAPKDVPMDATIDERLAYCWKNAQHVHRWDYSVNLKTGKKSPVYYPLSLDDWRTQMKTWRRFSLVKTLINYKKMYRARLHTNASGDFTLMSRQDWQAVRGYPQLEVSALHLDGLLCFAAHFGNAREKRLRGRKAVFHVDHGRNDGDTNVEPHWDTESKPERVAPKLPVLDFAEVNTWCIEMGLAKEPRIFNDSGWGLADCQLAETRPSEAESARFPGSSSQR